jgi:hypothetical protein
MTIVMTSLGRARPDFLSCHGPCYFWAYSESVTRVPDEVGWETVCEFQRSE